MDYPTPTGPDSIYGMLSGNNIGSNYYYSNTRSECPYFIKHAFRSADENFYVIDKSTRPVIVLYGEAESLIENYRKECGNINTKK